MSIGTVLNIKRFEIHDGPGIRSTLFLKGCPLRCQWCHNPESLHSNHQLALYRHKCTSCRICEKVCPTGAHEFDGQQHIFHREKCTGCGACARACLSGACQLFGKQVTAAALIDELLEDEDFYFESGGGVTISGGEPLMQAEFTAEILRRLKEKGIHTALDTSLYTSKENLDLVIPWTDLFLVDIKAVNKDTHLECTGVSNEKILKNLQYLDSIGANYEIRIPLIPHRNSDQIQSIAEFLSGLSHVGKVKLLPYHDLSKTKYESLGLPYTMGDILPPAEEEYQHALSILRNYGLYAVSSKE